MQDKSYEIVSSRTNASALSKSVVSTRPPTGLQNGDFVQYEVKVEDEKSSRPISKVSGSRKSSAKGSQKSVTVSRKSSASSRGSFVRSKTASSIRSNLRSSIASHETAGESGEKSIRPKSTPGSRIGDLENVEIIDEDGITHGQADVKTPKQSRGVSRKSSARRSAPIARTPLSTIRQKLMSNPSDISAIQEKLRSLYCTSANSISIPDYGVKVVAKTPPRTVITDRSGANSARSQRLTPIRPPQNSASRLEKSSHQSQELDILRRSESATKLSGVNSRTSELSIPVLGTKKELTDFTPRSDRKSNKRTTAASSRQLSNLLGYDIVSRHH
ncbi:uncharacterized protein LOC142357702, partial [Convolutriloba macropyga]|uniref:uncharacterized protein LOC142357702 n=1 Tax=Convolutriloba macropyga TaxID=536237 RepID=UPI003F51CC0A